MTGRIDDSTETIPLTEAPTAVKAGLAILPVSMVLIIGAAVYMAPKALLGEYASIEAMTSSTPFIVMIAGCVLGVAAVGLFLTEVGGEKNGI